MSVSSTSSKPTSSSSSHESHERKRKGKDEDTDDISKVVHNSLKRHHPESSENQQALSERKVTINPTIRMRDEDDFSQKRDMTPPSSISSQELDTTKVNLEIGRQEAIFGHQSEKKALVQKNEENKKKFIVEAISHYNLSVNLKCPLGMAYLGYYLIRQKDEFDQKRGRELLEASVKEGEAQGEAYLGDYLLEHGIKEDQKRGLALLKSSAVKKNREGLYYLGLYYFDDTAQDRPLDIGFAYLCFYLSDSLKYTGAKDYKNRCLDIFENRDIRAPDPSQFDELLSKLD